MRETKSIEMRYHSMTMDEVEKAISLFRNPYSCAQTIYAAFGGTDKSRLAYYKENSGGRAPENMCGALFAALELAPESERQAISASFAERVGSTKCREIKALHKTPCEECVLAAAEILKSKAKRA